MFVAVCGGLIGLVFACFLVVCVISMVLCIVCCSSVSCFFMMFMFGFWFCGCLIDWFGLCSFFVICGYFAGLGLL